ncbi:MAG: 50S ribosomal protein L27 [Patescibacteria group bacterium]
MAHVKGSGSVTQHAQGKRHGKRLGVKKYGGESVIPGNIILKQKGAKYKSGKGVGMGSDHTIFAMTEGKVVFGKKHGKVVVNVAA